MDNTVIILCIALVVIVLVWTFFRSRSILESWAKENGYQILSSEIRLFSRGPFFWTASNNQVVYYVTVQTSDGTVKRGWARCGSWWWGVFLNQVEIRWDE